MFIVNSASGSPPLSWFIIGLYDFHFFRPQPYHFKCSILCNQMQFLKLHLEVTIVVFYGMEKEEKIEMRSNLPEHILRNEKKINLSLRTHNTPVQGLVWGIRSGLGFYRQISGKQGFVGMGTQSHGPVAKLFGNLVCLTASKILPKVTNAKNNKTSIANFPGLGASSVRQGGVGLSLWIQGKHQLPL